MFDLCSDCARALEGAPMPSTLETQRVREARGLLRAVEVSAWVLYCVENDAWDCEACGASLTLDNY